MNSSMKIKRPLPPAPPVKRIEEQPALKPKEKTKKFVKSKEEKARSHMAGGQRIKEKRVNEAREKWDRMAKMASDGWSDKEIGEALGYTQKYAHERLKRLRRSGVQIPERKRGRKSEKEEAS